MTDQFHRLLMRVQKPARYVGGEYNQIIKDKKDVDVRVAFCFPDTYEIGMSNIGMRILYGVMNEMSGVWCERVFAPWGDMEDKMRAHGLPLWALESHDAVRDFDLVAFTLGYEMCYSNVLNMLELAQIPLLSKDRGGLENIVFAGGVCAVNPEPLADFIDFFSVGEGEESTPEIIECYRAAKKQGLTKLEFLHEVAKIEGVYVPSFYTHTYHEDGTLAAITPEPGAPERVKKRIVQDMNTAYFPTKTIVPSTQIVHDRSNLEIFRGCIRGCRFCQAGFCYRPIRAKSADVLCKQAIESLEDSGNSEITLASLSTSDYRELEALADGLLDYCEPRKINLSLPSPRAYVSIALPLPVGSESVCEILDFEIQDGSVDLAKLPALLNRTMPAGIRVLEAYESAVKIKHLTRLRAQITLEYDRGVPEQAERTITELFSGGPVLVKKRTKSGGEAELDLTPMIFGLSMRKASAQELELTVLVSAQNPSCNPQLLVNAIERYLPEQKPDFARIKRLEIYDEQGNPFR